MLAAKISISKIDYEKSFTELFPAAYEKLKTVESKNFALRFIAKLGEETRHAIWGILEKLDNESLKEILCRIIHLYSQEILEKVNDRLEKDEIGKNIRISKIGLVRSGGCLELYADEVSVNYRGLLDVPDIKKKVGEAAENKVQMFGKWFQKAAKDNAGTLAKAAAVMMPGEVERLGLNILRKKENRWKMLALAERALQEKGVWLNLGDVQFNQAGSGQEQTILVLEDGQIFSDDLEEKILDAAAEYVKTLLSKSK